MRTGLHANQTRDHNKIIDYYTRSGARVFKTLTFDADLLQKLTAMGVTVVGRLHFDEQPVGGTAGKNNMNRIIDAAKRHPYVRYWEGYNESYQGPQASQDSTQRAKEARDMSRYAEWELERLSRLAEIGQWGVAGNFSTGTPDLDTDAWEIFKPVVMAAVQGGHALGLHEYAGPYMLYMCETPDGKNQWVDGRFNGVSGNGMWDWNLQGWLMLRYRKVFQRYLKPWGAAGIKIFIGESGIDDTTPRPGPPGKGYKAFRRDGWDQIPGIGNYADQRRWYSVQTTHDDGTDPNRPNVMGVVDFGWDGTTTGWPDFDLSTDPVMVNLLIAAESSVPVGPGVPAPAPVPIPSPTPPPVPTPVPDPAPVPSPTPEAFVEPRIQVQPGQGWYAVARALLGGQPTGQDVAELMAANPTVAGLRPDQWLKSPWHRVVMR